MSILEVFETGKHKEEKAHIRNLIMIAKADGEVDEKELAFIEKMALKYNVSSEEVKQLCDHPEQVSIHPPVSKDERYQRMFNLSKMAAADGVLEFHEMALLRRYALGIGFTVDHLEQVVQCFAKAAYDQISLDEVSISVDEILGLA